MTRVECEAKLMELMETMVSVIKEYDPACNYLSCSYNIIPIGKPHIRITNDRYNETEGIGCFKTGDGPIYSYKDFMC